MPLMFLEKMGSLQSKEYHLTVRLDGGDIMIWGCFMINGTGELKVIEGTMSAVKYIALSEDCLESSVQKLDFEPDWVF